MNRASLFSMLICGLALAACTGPGPTIEPTLTSVPASPAAPTATLVSVPTATEVVPTDTPAGGGTRVEVKLVDNTISASLTTFKVGQLYTFVVSNRGRHEHNFIISPPVGVAGGYSEALAQALLAVDETQLPPGTSVSVDFTFPASAAGTDLEFNCLIRRHYEDGMRLAIQVTK
jgi:uncharacterized cupredoxin-like copper-binding protein